MFFIFGLKNRQRFKSYLLISGILWIIYYSVNVLVLNGELFNILFILFGFDVLAMITIYTIVGSFFWLLFIGFILLIIHGYKNKDNNMIYAGIVFYIGVVFSLILPILIINIITLFS